MFLDASLAMNEMQQSLGARSSGARDTTELGASQADEAQEWQAGMKSTLKQPNTTAYVPLHPRAHPTHTPEHTPCI